MSVNITRGFPPSFTSVTSISAKNCKIYTWVGYKVIFIFTIIYLYLVSLFQAFGQRGRSESSAGRATSGEKGDGNAEQITADRLTSSHVHKVNDIHDILPPTQMRLICSSG